MAIYIIRSAFNEGVGTVPYLWPILKAVPWLLLLWAVKFFFSGVSNKSERTMHGKVIMVTGGTSGVGEALVRDLATKGAQIVLLTQHALTDPFLVDFIDDMRRDTNNHLITAEQMDLESLHSIRTFATKWIDNAPPRRLDMVILCANTITPSSKGLQSTSEGVELNWQVNYLANFHFLSILSPALRAQPPDRDVRILIGNCSSYMGGDLLQVTQQAQKTASGKAKKTSTADAVAPTKFSPANAFATSKLAMTTFAIAFQKHLTAYKRPDGFPPSVKVIAVDPGYCRTPGMRRWLTGGSLFGLFVYLITYPIWWLVLKSPDMGAQSFLYAAMEAKFSRGEGGVPVKECKEREFIRTDVLDESKQKMLWEYSEQMVQEAEKRGAIERSKVKKEQEDAKEEAKAEEELKQYKEKVGKKETKKEGSRKSKKTG